MTAFTIPNVPCGCDSRKEIMFTTGRPGVMEAAILAVPLVALFVAWRYRR